MSRNIKSEQAEAGGSSRPVPEGLERARVLIVDDEEANVVLLERLIRSIGITDVHSVTDPRAAVQRCVEVGAGLVLLDLHMPRRDGFEVLAALRETVAPDAFVQVLVLTADNTADTRDRALMAGAQDFLVKPFDRTEVVLRVRNLLVTRSLHAALQRHNAALERDLEERAATDRRHAEEQRRRHESLDRAMGQGALTMAFQPIADLRSGDVLGVEALARFDCEPRQPPNEWFDDAAGVGRGSELELVAVQAALDQFDLLPPDAYLSVNLSPATLVEPELMSMLEGVPSHRVVLELTEHARIDDYDPVLSALGRFRDGGVRLAVDDAGAGYSGLRHVLRLQPDVLKLDITLTRDIDVDVAKRALGMAMVGFAPEIGTVLVAEGIETCSEFETLRTLGVPCGQGYHLARPQGLPLRQADLRALRRTAAASGP